jgi:hypothetical protein
VGAKSLIATVVLLVLTWTGTLLHDIDDIGLISHFSELEAESGHHHGLGHSHHDVSSDPSVAAPEMHGHDPAVMNASRNIQHASPSDCTPVVLAFASTDWFRAIEPVVSHARKERPPPWAQKIPIYLAYHAMLI